MSISQFQFFNLFKSCLKSLHILFQVFIHRLFHITLHDKWLRECEERR